MDVDFKSLIREIPDFPRPGILFYDITTLLMHPVGFRAALDAMTERVKQYEVTRVVGIESRGFIFGGPLADRLQVGFVPIRRPEKLPASKLDATYSLEYGSNSLAIHRDAVTQGEKVLLVDDLLATGGTASASVHLIEQLGGVVSCLAFLIELSALNGRAKFNGKYPLVSLLRY